MFKAKAMCKAKAVCKAMLTGKPSLTRYPFRAARAAVVLFFVSVFLTACQSQQSSSQSQQTPPQPSSSPSSSTASSTPSSPPASSPSSSSSRSSSSASSPSRASEQGGYESASPAGSPGTSGTPDYADPGVDAGQQGSGTASGQAGQPVLSDDERVAVLEGELDASITVFDGMILDQRNTIEGMEDAYSDQGFPEQGEEYGADGQGGGGLFEEGDLAADQEGVVPGMPGATRGSDEGSGASGSGDQEGGQHGAVTTGGNTGEGMEGKAAKPESRVPADIPDGRDDDIVARQIREAAMKEKDPVLREKLWDEYRKYKNQSK